jgi:hypothetical protein
MQLALRLLVVFACLGITISGCRRNNRIGKPC